MKKCYDLTEQPQDSRSFVKEFLKLSELKVYERGSVLYEQGEVLEHFWLLLEGYVETYVIGGNRIVKNYGILGPYSLMGMSSLSGYTGHSEVRAKTRVLAAVMPKERVSEWSREMLLSVIRIQTGKCRNAQDQLISMHNESTASRVAQLLLEIGNPYRKPENGSIPTLCQFSPRSIAEQINASQARVAQVLREMEAEGTVKTVGRSIVFIPDKLESYLDC